MRAVIQRVSEARVDVDGETVGRIGAGLLALVGVASDDTPEDARALAAKIVGLRVFEDDAGQMNRALSDVGGALLVVSQFTLLADCRKGRRPSFGAAAPPAHAEPLVEALVAHADSLGVTVDTGRFGAAMAVSLVNDGPVTLLLDTHRDF